MIRLATLSTIAPTSYGAQPSGTGAAQAGFLAVLSPEEFGGSGLKLDAAAVIMEEIQAAWCNGASAHAQMYIMNTLLRFGSAEQKATA